MTMAPVKRGWSPDHKILNSVESVIAFSVKDTGTGIAPDKHRIIFEAFQQADGTVTRRYGGTGLGPLISREIATLLGRGIPLHRTVRGGHILTVSLPGCHHHRGTRRR